MLRELRVGGAWVVLGYPCSPVKFFVCGVPESAGSGWLLCPAQPWIYPWPGEEGLLGAVCVLPSVSGTAGENTGNTGSWECVSLAGRAH